MVANVSSAGDRTSIAFGNNYPRAEIKKLITLYVYVEQIVFGKEGGSIKLKNFPDINFGYDTDSLVGLLAKNIPSIKFGEEDNKAEDVAIALKFPNSEPKQKIAKLCLQYAREWSTIAMAGGVDFKNTTSRYERKELKRRCAEFVRDNVQDRVEAEYGSVFLVFILITVILPAIISWSVHRLLDELFDV